MVRMRALVKGCVQVQLLSALLVQPCADVGGGQGRQGEPGRRPQSFTPPAATARQRQPCNSPHSVAPLTARLPW